MSRNAQIDQYQEHLLKAEADIENALKAICSLHGQFPRYELNEALENVQEALKGAWRFYEGR